MAEAEPVTVASALQKATSFIGLHAQRGEKEHIYSTLEDFTRTPKTKRLVVIGCVGAGKSTLLNVLAGWRLTQSPPDYDFKWEDKARGEGEDPHPPLFHTKADTASVTKKTAFSNIDFLGDSSRELVVVDTPGHDEPDGQDLASQEARDLIGELAADLHNKLKALGHVDAILVLHNDVMSNRLNPATFEILKMVDEKFCKSGHSVWENVVIGYSKCNAHDTAWRAGLDAKKAKLRQAIKDKIPNCKIDVPILPLGAVELIPAPPSTEHTDNLEKVWDFLQASKPLDSSQLQPFEGADVKWQQLINDKVAAEQQAKAALIYTTILVKLASILLVLFARNHALPGWMSFLLFNLPGPYDELFLVGLLVYCLGPADVFYSLRIFTNTHVVPRIEPALGPEMVTKAKVLFGKGPHKPKAE